MKRLSGPLVSRHVRPSLAMSTNTQLCWKQMVPWFSLFVPLKGSKTSELFFLFCFFFFLFRYILTDRTPGEPVFHAHGKLSQLLIMAFTRNCWRKTTSTLFRQQMQHPAGQTSAQGEKQRFRNKKFNLSNKKEIKWTQSFTCLVKFSERGKF